MQGNPFKNHIQLDRNHLKRGEQGSEGGRRRRFDYEKERSGEGGWKGLNLANLYGTLLGAYEVFTSDPNC